MARVRTEGELYVALRRWDAKFAKLMKGKTFESVKLKIAPRFKIGHTNHPLRKDVKK